MRRAPSVKHIIGRAVTPRDLVGARPCATRKIAPDLVHGPLGVDLGHSPTTCPQVWSPRVTRRLGDRMRARSSRSDRSAEVLELVTAG
jgi:hypothetical protein